MKWIDVNDRLPAKQEYGPYSKMVYVGYKNNDGDTFAWPAKYDHVAKCWEGLSNEVENPNLTVMCWQPFPDPPESSNSEKETQ